MAADPPPPRSGGGLSLYANLLEPEGNAPGSISRAPVVSQEALEAAKEQEASKKPAAGSAFRFQPHQQIRRPQQQKAQKPKVFPKVLPGAGNSAGGDSAKGQNAGGAPPPPPVKSSLADWAANEEDEYMYGTGDKRARGGRRKKKKKPEAAPAETDWDEIYDPSRPTNVDEYLRSDEKIREVQEWKALLYKHRRRGNERDSWDSEEEEERQPAHSNQFAPPASYSFAPPPPSPPRAPLPDDKSGDDAYARRLALTQGQAPLPPKSPSTPIPPPPPPPLEPDSSTISREPVRYAPPQHTQPQKDPDSMDIDEADGGTDYAPPEPPLAVEDEGETAAPRSSRPGQKGFAARLMSKYGWSKGQALGAEGSGILQPLRVQVEKRKKKSDAEGGGWAEPGGRGKIIGSRTGAGASSSVSESAGKFGAMSNVVVLRNMLDGMEDVQSEMENGLGQEIGEECGDKYGRVERLYIDIEGRRVFIKFTDQVSALRAVNALDGRVFAGNAIVPQYYDPDKFDRRIYE